MAAFTPPSITHDVRGGTWRFRCQCGFERTCNTHEAAVAAEGSHTDAHLNAPEPPRLTPVQYRAKRAGERAAMGTPKTEAERAAMAGPGGSYANKRRIRI